MKSLCAKTPEVVRERSAEPGHTAKIWTQPIGATPAHKHYARQSLELALELPGLEEPQRLNFRRRLENAPFAKTLNHFAIENVYTNVTLNCRLESPTVILNSINLHNFMSYGDSTLDLTSFSIACLSGLNGAGKSAILDGITWSLWESARSSSDELIRIGEQEMWVDLVFELENNRYRVRRARQRSAGRSGTKTTKGTLEYQIWSETAGGWTSLTAASMKETQQRITELLRMDYDTFINSVYLRQGRADEFTTRAPSERKQVLAEILGLNYFDRLQDLAKDEVRQRRLQVELLQHSLNGNANIDEHIAESNVELRTLASALQAKYEALTDNKDRLQRIQSELTELQSLESHMQPTQARLAELTNDLRTMQVTADKLTKRRDELSDTLRSAGELEEASGAFKHAKEKVEQLDHVSLRRQELEARQSELKSGLATMRGRMEVELEHQKAQRQVIDENAKKLQRELSGKTKVDAEHLAYKNLIIAEADMARKQETHVQLANRAEQLHTLVVEARLHLEAELDHKRGAHAELGCLIQSRDTLEAEENELQRQAVELDNLEIEFEGVEENGLKIKQQISELQLQVHEMLRRIAENDAKAKELEQAATLTMCPLCAAPIVDRMAVMARYQTTEQDIRAQIRDLEYEISILEDKRNELRKTYQDLRRRLDTRKVLDKKIGEFNARKAALERADTTFLKLTTDVAELERRLAQQDYAYIERESLINIKAEIHKLDFDPVIYHSLQAQIRAQRHIEVRHQQLKRDFSELEKLQQDMPEMDERITDVTRRLDTNDFGGEQRTELQELSEKLGQLDYDRVEHQSLRQELARLLPLVDRFKELDRAQDELPHVAEELNDIEESIAAKNDLHRSLQRSVADWAERLSRLPGLATEKAILEDSMNSSEREKHDLGRQVAVLESNLERLKLEHTSISAKRAQIDELLTAMNDYEYLAETFGKKGIQAIIIENAVPEIETEANNILSRLSDNQMHVALVTQHRTKQGSIQETLDIVIADDVGTRNYELYSGGEAFKINFAIRVALSRLLARRAGAKLQSLIVDEGFGSQDEISRTRLMEAIHAIKPDFAKILIVTHIAEIKELFPVQIHVQKENGISTLNLVHAF